MFNEYKQSFKEYADLAPGWNKLTFTELCDKYNEYKELNKLLAESYFSALMYKSWYMIEILYHTTMFGFLTCYDMVVDSLLYILEANVWNNKDSSLYGDPEGAERAFNTVVRTNKVGLYERETNGVRKINWEAHSLNELIEEHEDSISDKSLVTNDLHTDDHVYDHIVKEFIVKKNYFAAILIDMLTQGYGFNHQPFSIHAEGYNKRELKFAILHYLDEQYCEYFAKRYNADFVEVLDYLQFIFNCTQDRLDRNIKYTFRLLRKRHDINRILKFSEVM